MAKLMGLREAVEEFVHDGDTVALEGFTHLIPHAAGHEVIRQGRRELTLVRMTPDIIYDQIVGAGCARKLVFSWGGNPGVGSLHRIRNAIEQGQLELDEHSHAGMAAAYRAGAAGIPFGVLRGYVGSELRKVNSRIRDVICPFSGEVLAAVPAIAPDVTIVHAQRSDVRGNVLIEGLVGVQKEAILAADRSVVTVEEVVDDLGVSGINSLIIPSWAIHAVVEVPGGAHPSYAYGYYERDNEFYKEWDDVSRSRARFEAWIEANVMKGPLSHPKSSGSSETGSAI